MNTLPKFTEGPWLREESTVYALMPTNWQGKPDVKNRFFANVQRDLDCPQEEIEANAQLIASAPLLYMALWAQSTLDTILSLRGIPDADCHLYEPFLGIWDKKENFMDRYRRFTEKVQQLRAEALKQARGE